MIESGDNWVTPINLNGPRLQVQGDFGISATIESATADLAAISLFGALPQGEWWKGIKRLDVGIASGQVSVTFWDGTSSGAVLSRSFPDHGLSGQVQLEIRLIGDEFAIRANGVEVGRLKDPGAFPEDQVYLGANVAPNNKLTIHRLSIETAPGKEGNVHIVTPDTGSYAPSDPPLRDLAQARGTYIGAAVAPNHLRCERAYAEALGHEFNPKPAYKALHDAPADH